MQIKFRELLYASNLLSISRILLIPPIYYCIKIDTRTGDLALLAMLVLAIITDILDGYLARQAKHGDTRRINPLGEVLDPIADKLLLAATLIPFYILTKSSPQLGGLPIFGGIPLWTLLVFEHWMQQFAGRQSWTPAADPYGPGANFGTPGVTNTDTCN